MTCFFISIAYTEREVVQTALSFDALRSLENPISKLVRNQNNIM